VLDDVYVKAFRKRGLWLLVCGIVANSGLTAFADDVLFLDTFYLARSSEGVSSFFRLREF
jgi:hypothetical protein